ncbi:MAG: site-2 protease family protein [Hyphomicrobiaceae bacterium]
MLSGGSFKLFSVAGTDVKVHPTFFLLLAWIGVMYWLSGGPAAAVSGIIFILLLFVCVLLHEFGHIFAASRYGIRTPDITLLPIGGVASLERMPEKPSQEIVVALAGPAVTLAIAIVLIAALGFRFDVTDIARLEDVRTSMVGRLAAANVALLVFNLIPAFPMDGGRVLRALLAIRLGHTQATRVAARIGQMFAVLLGFLGLLGNPLLVLVAVFVFMAAAGEAGYVQVRDLTRGYLAADAMITTYEPLSPLATADDGAALLLATTQQEFLVVDGAGTLRGVVTRQALIKALSETGGATPVLDIMTADVPMVSERASLDSVFQALQRREVSVIGVAGVDGRLKGYISPENLSELIMIRSAKAKQV